MELEVVELLGVYVLNLRANSTQQSPRNQRMVRNFANIFYAELEKKMISMTILVMILSQALSRNTMAWRHTARKP